MFVFKEALLLVFCRSFLFAEYAMQIVAALPYTIACNEIVTNAPVQLLCDAKINSSGSGAKNGKNVLPNRKQLSCVVDPTWCTYKTSCQHGKHSNSTVAIRSNVRRELQINTIQFFYPFAQSILKWLIFRIVVVVFHTLPSVCLFLLLYFIPTFANKNKHDFYCFIEIEEEKVNAYSVFSEG